MVSSKMGRYSALLLLVGILALDSVVNGLSDEQKKECQKHSKRTLKTMMKSFAKCNDQLKLHHISGEEYQKKIGCVVKCVMKSVNVLDDKDIMTEESLSKSIEAHIPPELQAPAHQVLMGCVKTHGPSLDPKDDTCKAYLDLGTCMQGAVAEACGDAPMM